jgi:hypothetical protein
VSIPNCSKMNSPLHIRGVTLTPHQLSYPHLGWGPHLRNTAPQRGLPDHVDSGVFGSQEAQHHRDDLRPRLRLTVADEYFAAISRVEQRMEIGPVRYIMSNAMDCCSSPRNGRAPSPPGLPTARSSRGLQLTPGWLSPHQARSYVRINLTTN